MSKHTPTPWEYVHENGAWEGYHEPIKGGDFPVTFRTDTQANAKRIVECVNAMEGIEDPSQFIGMWETIKHLELDAYHKLKKQNDLHVSLLQDLKKVFEEGKSINADSSLAHAVMSQVESKNFSYENH